MPTRPNRHLFTLTIAQIRQLKELGVIRAAPENRAVIADNSRPRGTCEGYWNSLREGMNAGQMLGYSLDDCNVFAQAARTGVLVGRTAFVTDFGHRFDWLTRPANTITFNDGNTLASLSTANREDYDALMATEIAISISTHPDKEFLHDFVKAEYMRVNTNSTPLEGGELARGLPVNQTRADPESLAKTLLETYYPATHAERDNRLLVSLSLVSGAAKGSDHFHRKVTGENDILTTAREPLTENEQRIASDTLTAWSEAEARLEGSLTHAPADTLATAETAVESARQLRDSSPRGGKVAATAQLKEAEKHLKQLRKEDKDAKKEMEAKKKLLEQRILDHANAGPLLYGFRKAVERDLERGDGLSTEVDAAKDIYQRWMMLSLESKKTWVANRKDVATRYGDNNSARYYNEARFKAGWTRMQTMLGE